ncbi:transglycosylase domain-containing protein [Planococcus lenghuensis]|uniref:Peptidoglycan glycosyltransferase n=1 Tax=Planococcus lenghuensis TaxID=2213202 RepID=A0A1Q2KX69_9BACL|nr:transglycosylase domain-containing protein [Planococcus lenghuensis]AQQ52791.1 peptidoglycan glycosyltransferase [Planococcus lenghuensis]
MKDRLTTWFTKAEESYDKFVSSRWMKGLRITSGVFWNLALLLAIFLVAGGIFAASVGAGYFASLVDETKLLTKEEMREQIFAYTQTSELFFSDEQYLGKLRTDLEREEITLDDVSQTAIDAVLATEDEYFNEHEGIVPKAVLRGLVQDLTNAPEQTGGSTLTQQLIKNQILTNEVSYERKAKEMLLAMRLEQFMNKDEIMEAYLNIIPYGRNSSGANIAGIETASQGIFGVSADELSLPQAAFIAGIPKAPFSYTPFTRAGAVKDAEGLEPGINRMKTVLFRMKETGYITEEEYNAANAYDITQDFRENEPRSFEEYPFLTFELERRATRILMDVLAEKNGVEPESLLENDKLYEEYAILAERALYSGGYRIHSTIDKETYIAMEEAKDAYEQYGYTYPAGTLDGQGNPIEDSLPVQVGSVLIENRTGRIVSFVGGRDYELENYNHATQAYRSIGSSAKPLLVYGPAVEKGLIGAGSPVVDVKFELEQPNGDVYEPTNYYGSSEQGIMPARAALASSQNLPALRLYYQMMDDNPLEYAMKAGLTSIDPEYENVPSAPLGGGIEGTVEQVANAYTTFANGGEFIDAYMVDRIEDADGNIVFEQELDPVQVFSPQTAYILTDMMRDTFTGSVGTARRAESELAFIADFAGKTGTTQESKDSWLTGFNPNVTLTTWLGYDNEYFTLDDPANNSFPHPSTRNNVLWATLMNSIYEVNPELVGGEEEAFVAPEGVVTRPFCAFSGMAPGGGCTGSLVREDLFNAEAMVPSQPDDSITSGSYTTVNGTRYAALPSTPSDFTSGGRVGVSSEFVDRMLGELGGEPGKLFPPGSPFSNVVSGAKFKADSSAPAAVTAERSGDSIRWSNSSSNDVVGYRIYTGSGSRIASIAESEENTYRLPRPGSYYVVAVDITGRTSSASNRVIVALPEPDPVPASAPEPAEPEPEPAAEEPSPPAEEPAPAEGDGAAESPPADEGDNGTAEEPAPPAEEPTPPEDDAA